jgi:hypothetical protein
MIKEYIRQAADFADGGLNTTDKDAVGEDCGLDEKGIDLIKRSQTTT